jgi:hypothetical protein
LSSLYSSGCTRVATDGHMSDLDLLPPSMARDCAQQLTALF